MVGPTARKLTIAAGIICTFVILYPLLFEENILTLEFRFHKQSLSKTSPGCDLGISPKDTNSYNFITMCAEQKRKVFEYVLTKSNQPHKETPEQQQKQMELILLSQLNRDIPESSYGQMNNQMQETHQNDVIVVGTVNTSRPYAVFSTTIANREAMSFIFLLPLTVMSWKRVGFESVILVVGWRDVWNTDPLYSDIFLICRKLGAVLIFLQPKPENNIMISQVSRLFAANILQKEFKNQPGIQDVYMITTDTDIWPLNGTIYQLPDKYDVLSLNSFCCTPFTHRNARYNMLPMTNIGAKIRTWGKLTETNGTIPTTINDILSMFQEEFGAMVRKPVSKGQNMGWYLDQYMVSIRVDRFLKASKINKTENVKFVGRDTGSDRIDRISWALPNGIQGKVDSHLLLNTFIESVWVHVTKLLRFMYAEKSPEYDFCVNYYKQYNESFAKKFKEIKSRK